MNNYNEPKTLMDQIHEEHTAQVIDEWLDHAREAPFHQTTKRKEYPPSPSRSTNGHS